MAKKKIKKWSVDVSRIGYGNNSIEVEASTREDAERIALEKAPSLDYSEHDSDYEVQGSMEID
jgi:hypothetical protein